MELLAFRARRCFAPDPPTDDEASAAWEQVDVIRASCAGPSTRRLARRPGACVRNPFDERSAFGVEGADLRVDLGARLSTATNNAS
jgi:hypothetical protein